MLNNLLSTNVQKQVIGITLSPAHGLEVVVYDRTKNAVVNYGRKKAGYNFSTREISDYVQFKSALSELVQDMNIAPKSLAYLILPSVYFDFIKIPNTIEKDQIPMSLLSKAEEFYIFKKEEPVSGWCEVINPDDSSQKKLAYSSFQKRAVDELKDIFTDVGLTLAGVENAFSATVRGLYVTGKIDDLILEHANWTCMIVNINSFTLLDFNGKDLLNCNEVPIAIRSFSTEEAYSAIASSASQLLSSSTASKLFIISQTDDICADVLKRQMQFDREVETIDTNKYSKKPIVEVLQAIDFSKANTLSFSSIGACVLRTDFNLVLNAMADDPNANLGVYFTKNILGMDVDITRQLVLKICVILIVIIAIIVGFLYFLIHTISEGINKQNQDLDSQIQQIDAKIAAIEVKVENNQEIDINKVIDEVAQINVNAIRYYDSISNDIPKNIWLTKYFNQQGDRIVIQGIAESITDIYEYFKNLKIISPQSDIKLNEIKVITADSENDTYKGLSIDKDKDRLYSFEISNTKIGFNSEGGSLQSSPPTTEKDIIINGLEQMSQQAVPAQ